MNTRNTQKTRIRAWSLACLPLMALFTADWFVLPAAAQQAEPQTEQQNRGKPVMPQQQKTGRPEQAAETVPPPTPKPPVQNLDVPPPVAPAPYNPLPNLPPIALDEANNNVGIAQQTARAKKLQARILWIDGTANMNAINTRDKIVALVGQIKKAGFNTVVLDVKPIVGFTLYPSKYAPKLTTWKDRSIPLDFDPLPDMITNCHQNGLQLVVNMNVFSEGHRGDNNTVKKQGPGYAHPEWQTVLYTAQTRVRPNTPNAPSFLLSQRVNQSLPANPSLSPGIGQTPNPPSNQSAVTENEIMVYTDVKALPSKAEGFAVAVSEEGRVIAQVEGKALSLLGSAPWRGAYFVGVGAGADYLRQNAPIGCLLALDNTSAYIPHAQMQEQVPLMMNPNRQDVQQRMRDMLREVCTNYEIDGVIFDDRFRYAGINADFSEETRRQFETYLAPVLAGRTLRWPDDVFRYDFTFPTLARRVTPGPYYDAWLTFRALALRNWLAGAVAVVKAIRPNATVSTYNGSWYGDYAALGANWAADDFSAGFRFLTPTYQKTGYAGLTDWITTGCYYPTPTMADALSKGKSVGATIEAAGQLSNRAINDQAWVYAGLNVADYGEQPEKIKSAVQAALATTQGVMIFDLSAFDATIWSIFEEAFKESATAPHAVAGLLAQVRQQRAARKASGAADPPVIIHNGIPGTGL